MENRDANGEQQVWQRVFSQAMPQGRDDLRPLQMAAMELAASYRNLVPTLTGRARELAKQLYTGETANLLQLRGIGRLTGRGEEALKIWNPGKEPARKVLEACYHKTRRAMAEYMSRSAEGEFGMVFRTLADRAGMHCAMIAELLGMIS